MKKRQKTTLIILFCLNIIVYGAFGINLATGKNKTDTDETTISQTQLSDITTLSLSSDGETINLKEENGKWEDSDNPDTVINQSAALIVADKIQNLTASRLVSSDGDYSSYGLDNPVYTVTAGDGTNSVTYEIGNFNDSIGKYYVCEKDSPNIYAIYQSAAETIMASPISFIMAYDFDSVSSDNAKYIKISSNGNEITLNHSGEDKEIPLGSNSSWTIEGLSFADNYKISEIYDTIKTIGSSNCAGSDNSLLGTPSAQFEIGFDSPLTAVLGNINSDGTAYMKFSTSDKIYSVDSDSVKKLTDYTDKYDFVSQSVCAVALTNLKAVDVKYGENEYKFEITGENACTLNGKECDYNAFKDFYNKLNGISSTSHKAEAESIAPSDKSITVTFETTSEKYPSYTAVYTPYDESWYTAKACGMKGRLVNIRTIESVIKLLNAVTEN